MKTKSIRLESTKKFSDRFPIIGFLSGAQSSSISLPQCVKISWNVSYLNFHAKIGNIDFWRENSNDIYLSSKMRLFGLFTGGELPKNVSYLYLRLETTFLRKYSNVIFELVFLLFDKQNLFDRIMREKEGVNRNAVVFFIVI